MSLQVVGFGGERLYDLFFFSLPVSLSKLGQSLLDERAKGLVAGITKSRTVWTVLGGQRVNYSSDFVSSDC